MSQRDNKRDKTKTEGFVLAFNSIKMFTNLINASAQMHPELLGKDVVLVCSLGPISNFSVRASYHRKSKNPTPPPRSAILPPK